MFTIDRKCQPCATLLQVLCDKLLQLLWCLLFDPDQLIIILATPVIPIRSVESADCNEAQHRREVAFAQLLIRILLQISRADFLSLNFETWALLLCNLQDLILTKSGTLYIDRSILECFWLLEDANDCLADIFESGCTVLVITTIVDCGCATFEICPEADLKSPVQEETIDD